MERTGWCLRGARIYMYIVITKELFPCAKVRKKMRFDIMWEAAVDLRLPITFFLVVWEGNLPAEVKSPIPGPGETRIVWFAPAWSSTDRNHLLPNRNRVGPDRNRAPAEPYPIAHKNREMAPQIAYHRFANLQNYTAFNGVASPSDLIIAYIVLFALPKPENKKTCGYFTTDASKTYQVGEACPLPGAKDSKTPLEIPELKDKEPNHFCMSTRHAAMLLDDGSVWTWGANDVGQLGHGDETELSRPKKVASDVPFQKIFCAANATIGLARGGDVFQWGQLNPRSTEKWNAPHKCGIGNVEFLYVGAEHAGVTKGPKLFTWGNGADGRLGIGGTQDVSCDKPERVKLAVEDVAMATRSTAVIDETGRVRVFGKNYGNLKPKQTGAILNPTAVKRLSEAETLAGTWTDDFYLANLEDRTQMIFGDMVAIDDPDANKDGPGVSKGSPPRKLKNPMKF